MDEPILDMECFRDFGSAFVFAMFILRKLALGSRQVPAFSCKTDGNPDKELAFPGV